MTRTPFVHHTGIAAPLLIDHIDTDQIIPSREMKQVSQEGLADGLFAGWRYADAKTREPDPNFILNTPAYRGATILLAGENFGCGSSREHAVWALVEYGIRAVIAVSFGGIFAGNATRNGLLPVSLTAKSVQTLAERIGEDPQSHPVTIDLKAQTVSLDEFSDRFEIEGYAKRLLLEGLDPIGLTLQQQDAIETFQSEDAKRRPWVYAVSGEAE